MVKSGGIVFRGTGDVAGKHNKNAPNVVFCEDCEFWDRSRVSYEGLARCMTGESGTRYRGKDDFCSRGKRR